MQMLSFADGAVLDDFQLHKPADWKADVAGQAAYLSSFNQTYEESWLENPGTPFAHSSETCAFKLQRAASIWGWTFLSGCPSWPFHLHGQPC